MRRKGSAARPFRGIAEKTVGGLAVALVASALAILPATPALAATGQFHVFCTFSHAASDDPIVHPGAPGTSHLHDFFGNVSTDAFSTFASMRAAGTSCNFGPDNAGYWIPALIAPGGAVVTPQHITVYYIGAPETVTPPPSDLRIVAGGDTSNLNAGYTCGEGQPTSPVTFACGGGLDMKGVIVFPSCWDGSNTDSADHRSHVVYPIGGSCPKSYPVRIPRIGIHISYGLTDGTGYYLSSDMASGTSDGRSLHADFWNTWDQPTLEQEVAGCINAGKNCGDLNDGSSPPSPSSAPSVQSLNPTSGPAGTSVTIAGTHLSGTTSVMFNHVSAGFVVSSDTQLTATVPAGATSGRVSVTTPSGSAMSTSDFTVTGTGTGGSMHERQISLLLSGRLLARGRVSVADGFTACSVGVRVMIQRFASNHMRSRGGWRTIGHETTGADGKYRLRIRARTSRYRALVTKTTSSTDPCGRATSRVKLYRR